VRASAPAQRIDLRSTVPLTPADIHHVEFGKAPLGRRGYDEEQVDALLDEVSEEMAELLEEKDVLQRQAGRDDLPADHTTQDNALRAEFSAVSAEFERARRECEQAQQNAHGLQRRLAEARQAAAAPAAARSGDNPDIVMAMAQRTADDHLHESRRQSHALAAQARAESERVVDEARHKVQTIEEDIRRRQREAAAELQAGDAALRRQVEELAGFAESYRAALAEHLRLQSQYLDDPA
jgi:DivIVA domain-containing protein